MTVFSAADLQAKEYRERWNPLKPFGKKDLAELEKLDEQSTPGPWKACMDLAGVGDSYGPEDGIQYGGECDFGGIDFGQFHCSTDPAADVRLIAAMRTHLPALLAIARKHLEKDHIGQ